ncbi:MAG TPA: ATP-binding protein [Caulifigura sp.]|nr:ATP-binding protein [Caulifigura sp.]
MSETYKPGRSGGMPRKPVPNGKAPARQSLRTRLAVWNAAVVILTTVATLLMLRQGVTLALFHEIDEILKEDFLEVGLMLTEIPPSQFDVLADELNRKAEGHRQHGWFVELRGENDKLVWWSDEKGPRSLAELNKPTAEFRVRKDSDPPRNEHGVTTVYIGTDLKLLNSDLTRIDQLVVMTASLIFAVTPLFAYWLAGRATHAVGEITRTASRLRPDRLDERLPLRGTGDELDQLAITINGLLDRIAVFLDQKRDTLANAAHELRTPLAAIRSSVEVALNEERTPREYQEILEDIIDQSGSLQILLNQLLLLSEVEAERLKTQVELVELEHLVSKSVAMFQGVAEMRDISLALSKLDAGTVTGSKVHLQQVVNNLIDNALKYTPAGGKVTVSLTALVDRKMVEFKVADTGVGIAAEDVPRVFDRFFRVDRSRSRGDTPDGTGLGLSICKAVVEAHGGQIRCESVPGRGSVFSVELQMADAEVRISPHRYEDDSRSVTPA